MQRPFRHLNSLGPHVWKARFKKKKLVSILYFITLFIYILYRKSFYLHLKYLTRPRNNPPAIIIITIQISIKNIYLLNKVISLKPTSPSQVQSRLMHFPFAQANFPLSQILALAKTHIFPSFTIL